MCIARAHRLTNDNTSASSGEKRTNAFPKVCVCVCVCARARVVCIAKGLRALVSLVFFGNESSRLLLGGCLPR